MTLARRKAATFPEDSRDSRWLRSWEAAGAAKDGGRARKSVGEMRLRTS